MKKTIAFAALAGALAFSGAAFAAQGDNTTNGSSCGQYHAARADVYGAPAIGAGGAPSLHNGMVGQEFDPATGKGATGYNNSHGDCQAGLNNPN